VVAFRCTWVASNDFVTGQQDLKQGPAALSGVSCSPNITLCDDRFSSSHPHLSLAPVDGCCPRTACRDA